MQVFPFYAVPVRRPHVVGNQPVGQELVHLLVQRSEGHRLEQVEEILLQHSEVVVDDGSGVDVERQGVRLALSGQFQPSPLAKLLRGRSARTIALS